MNWKTQATGDTVAETSVRQVGGKWRVEVLDDQCRLFRLKREFECGGRMPTRNEIGRAFALWPEQFGEVKT